MSVYRCARCGFAYDPSLPSCYKCQLPRGAPWEPMHPAATLREQTWAPSHPKYLCVTCGLGGNGQTPCSRCGSTRWRTPGGTGEFVAVAPPQAHFVSSMSQPQAYPQLQPQPQPQPQQLLHAAAAARPNRDQLRYGGDLVMPQACACCMGPAERTLSTKLARTGNRRYSAYLFPYCHRCMAHRTWSGHAGVGAVRALWLLFAGGGVAGGILLGLALGKEGPEPEKWAGLLGFAGAIVGYIVCMILVRLVGRLVAPCRPECTDTVVAVRGDYSDGRWQFRFTNPQFEDAFRAMNRGS